MGVAVSWFRPMVPPINPPSKVGKMASFLKVSLRVSLRLALELFVWLAFGLAFCMVWVWPSDGRSCVLNPKLRGDRAMIWLVSVLATAGYVRAITHDSRGIDWTGLTVSTDV